MSKKYHEVEVFVRVQYRHKLIIESSCEDIAGKLAMKQLLSEPIEDWCDEGVIEHWKDNPDIDCEEDQFEICNIWDCTSDHVEPDKDSKERANGFTDPEVIWNNLHK